MGRRFGGLRFSLAWVLTLAIVLPSCQTAPTPDARPSATAPSATRPAGGEVAAVVSPSPARPKRLVIGMSQEPAKLYMWGGEQYVTQVVGNLLFSQLVGIDDKMNPYPDLVESVPTLENGGARYIGEGANRQLQVTFKLRPGVTWSDGQPLTAADVKFTYDLFMNPASGGSRDMETKFESLATPDERTVVITYLSENSAKARNPKQYAAQSGPVSDPNYMVGMYNVAWIFPEHILGPLVDHQPLTSPKASAIDKSEFARQPVGTGPYKLVKWDPGQSLTLQARPEFFKGKPRIDTVVFRFVATAESLIAGLKAGEIDVITQDALDTSNAPVLDPLSNVRVYYVPGTTWEHIDLNLDNPVLASKEVRQALMYGLNRQELVDKVFLGKTQVAHSQVVPGSWAYNPNLKKYPYDPRKAEEMLDAAGYPRGSDGIRAGPTGRLSFTLQTTDSSMRAKVTQLIQDQWAKIGVQVKIDQMPAKVLNDKKTGPIPSRTFQMAEYAWVGGLDPGADQVYAMASQNIPTRENEFQGGNYPGYRNPRNDQLLTEVMATLDRGQRTRIFAELQDLWQEDLPTLELFLRPNTSVATTRLKNFRPGISSIGETWNIAGSKDGSDAWDLAD